MGRFCVVPVLLVSAVLFAQDTISVDAVSTMHVCTDKNPGSSDPCATPPHPLSKISPSYPEKARRLRSEGTVTLGLIVTKDGSSQDVHVVKGVDDDLNQAAIAAVKQWKFEPATYKGAPVAVEWEVAVNFKLAGNSSQFAGTSSQNGAAANSDQLRNLYTDAHEAYNRRNYQTAANLARRLTTLSPQYGSAWGVLGISLLELNQLDAAVSALATAIKIDPASTLAYNNLGRVYWRQRKYEEAAAQFRKQIVINPQDHYAHGNLGMLLRDQKKCSDAMPELEKALAITPNNADVLAAQGECDIDLGNRAKGISELEQATSASSAPYIWNAAAYHLAKRNIELDRAEKWSETALTMESARLHSVSLEHLTPEQLNYVFWIAHYWDTRGWIYFLRGDNAKAQSYTAAAWWLLPLPTIGDHLGQIYQKTGQTETAIHTYAMAIAAAERPTRSFNDPDDVADAKQRFAQLAGHDANLPSLIGRGRTDLEAMTAISIPNTDKSNGSADFTLRIAAGEKALQVRQISGNASWQKAADALQSTRLPLRIPDAAAVEIPLRGTLTCKADEVQCRFSFLSSEGAVDLARNEAAIDTSSTTETAAVDPHIYNDPAMGMRISLPDEWRLVKKVPGTFSQPHSAVFGKPGTTAFFVLARERLEGTPDLYKKMLESTLSRSTNFKRNGENSVSRDGVAGTRWSVTWDESGGIAFSAVVEFFTVGDDHYRMMAAAPKEVYGRYAENFENMLRSVQFPMLHADPRLLEGMK